MLREPFTKKGICPICQTERDIRVGSKTETLTIKNESIEIDADVEYCDVCKEFFADVDSEEKNIQKAYRIYRNRHGLLQPEEIKEIRQKYGLGQRAFSKLLGWGEITIHRYENGALQDEIHNNELLLLRDPENFSLLFERNKNRLSPRKAESFERMIEGFLQEKDQVCFYRYLENFFNKACIHIDSGFRLFDLEKFENAILYFTGASGGVFKTKLNKLLWYFDFLTFKNTNVSATGAIYMHLDFGFVPLNYEFYLAKLVKDEVLFVKEIIFDQESDIAGEIYSSQEKADLSGFSETERHCLRKVFEFFRGFSAAKVSEYCHKELAYKETACKKIVSYNWARELSLSL